MRSFSKLPWTLVIYAPNIPVTEYYCYSSGIQFQNSLAFFVKYAFLKKYEYYFPNFSCDYDALAPSNTP